MKITIDADIFNRMSHAAASPSDTLRPHLACVRLEYRGGRAYAVASNSFIMAIHYLGETDQPDEFMNVALDPSLMTLMPTLDTLAFEGWQTINLITLPEFALIWGACPEKEPMFTEWWKLIPDPAKVERGFIFLEDELFHKLALSSPSGIITFPAVVDAKNYMYVRDAYDPNWLGLLHARDKDKQVNDPATIPDWIPRT